jgi:hypothetical protein
MRHTGNRIGGSNPPLSATKSLIWLNFTRINGQKRKLSDSGQLPYVVTRSPNLESRRRACSSPPQERKGYVRIPRPLTPSAHHRHARFERARNAAHGAGSPVTKAPDASGLARSPVPRRCRAARHRVVPRRDRARGPAWARETPSRSASACRTGPRASVPPSSWTEWR